MAKRVRSCKAERKLGIAPICPELGIKFGFEHPPVTTIDPTYVLVLHTFYSAIKEVLGFGEQNRNNLPATFRHT